MLVAAMPTAYFRDRRFTGSIRAKAGNCSWTLADLILIRSEAHPSATSGGVRPLGSEHRTGLVHARGFLGRHDLLFRSQFSSCIAPCCNALRRMRILGSDDPRHLSLPAEKPDNITRGL